MNVKRKNTGGNDTNADPEGQAKKLLAPVVFVTCFLGIVASAVEAVANVVELSEQYFYLATAVLWLCTILLLWRWQVLGKAFSLLGNRFIRLALATFTTLVFLFAVGWRVYIIYFIDIGPGPGEEPRIPVLPSFQFSPINSAWAQTDDPAFKIASFYLNKDFSSYIESAGRSHQVYEFDRNVLNAFMDGTCIGEEGVHPIARVVPIFRRHIKNRGREDLLKYISSTRAFSRLGSKNYKIFNEIMFSDGDLIDMQSTNPKDFEDVRNWIIKCVGQYQPVFSLVVKNLKQEPILISEIVYDVSVVKTYLGGMSGVIYPEHVYDHYLKHQTGEQTFQITPPFIVAPGDFGSFSVRLYPADKGKGLSWTLKIKLRDSDGHEVETDYFEVIMSKYQGFE